jgi:hypothetical protein
MQLIKRITLVACGGKIVKALYLAFASGWNADEAMR